MSCARLFAVPIALALLAGPAFAQEPQTWRGEGIHMGGTAEGDALAGAAEGFRQVAEAWRGNDARRAALALQIARRWLGSVPRPEVAALDERASRLGQSIALHGMDVVPGALALERDARLLSQRLGGARPIPFATHRPAAIPSARTLPAVPAGAPGRPPSRPPGMYAPGR